jgi:hypothetical protein
VTVIASLAGRVIRGGARRAVFEPNYLGCGRRATVVQCAGFSYTRDVAEVLGHANMTNTKRYAQ